MVVTEPQGAHRQLLERQVYSSTMQYARIAVYMIAAEGTGEQSIDDTIRKSGTVALILGAIDGSEPRVLTSRRQEHDQSPWCGTLWRWHKWRRTPMTPALVEACTAPMDEAQLVFASWVHPSTFTNRCLLGNRLETFGSTYWPPAPERWSIVWSPPHRTTHWITSLFPQARSMGSSTTTQCTVPRHPVESDRIRWDLI